MGIKQFKREMGWGYKNGRKYRSGGLDKKAGVAEPEK